MLRLSRRLAVAAMAALAVFGFGSAEAQQPQPIRIGAVLAVTGGAAFLGDPAAKTLRLYVERINRAGGVLGRPLELRL